MPVCDAGKLAFEILPSAYIDSEYPHKTIQLSRQRKRVPPVEMWAVAAASICVTVTVTCPSDYHTTRNPIITPHLVVFCLNYLLKDATRLELPRSQARPRPISHLACLSHSYIQSAGPSDRIEPGYTLADCKLIKFGIVQLIPLSTNWDASGQIGGDLWPSQRTGINDPLRCVRLLNADKDFVIEECV